MSRTNAQAKSQTRKLAAQIQKATTAPRPVPSMVKGVVTAWNSTASPPTVAVQLSGASDGNTANYQYLDSYWPTVGDTVHVVSQAGKHLVLGTVESSDQLSGWNEPTLQYSVTSIGGGGGPIFMRLVRDNGALKIQMKGSVSISGGASNPQLLFDFSPAPSSDRLIICVTNTGTPCYVQYTTAGAAELYGGTASTSCAILDGHEFFL